jgi:hypothetical protein
LVTVVYFKRSYILKVEKFNGTANLVCLTRFKNEY